MEYQGSMNPQQFFGFPWSIPSFNTSTETAYAYENPQQQGQQQQQKPRFTRAEKRQYAKEKMDKKASLVATRRTEQRASKKGPRPASSDSNDADEVITRALSTIVELIDLRKGRNRKPQKSGLRVSKTLEQRITRDAPKKAEPSAKKLEKIQKRKEIRLERRKTKLALRAQQTTQEAETTVPAVSIPHIQVQQDPTQHET
jgi:hypothetical protein